MIKVLVVDDHQLVRVGTSRLLDDVDSLDVVDNAENGEEAIEKVRSLDPDLVLMDIQMPVMSGLDATLKIRQMDGKKNEVMDK